MPTITHFAEKEPDRLAVVHGNGESSETYADLDLNSRRIAHLLQGWGLKEGDTVAVLMGNEERFFDLYWAAIRLGLYFTPVNWHLAPAEVAYILDDCDAQVVFASSSFRDLAESSVPKTSRPQRLISLHGHIDGFTKLDELLSAVPEGPSLKDEREGQIMLYSSGTTGKPKGVKRALLRRPFGDPAADALPQAFSTLFGMEEGDCYLSPAPLYHAAPLGFCGIQHRLGATAVVMRRFDAENALRMIQDQGITTSQWVPTHFKRLLQLPPETRCGYDLRTLRLAVHAAAPCPVPVKRAMIEWWGPILVEYYAGTEGGGTLIRSEEWLEHPGSVGRHWAGGKIHVLDEEGKPITEPGRDGIVYFEAADAPDSRFEYHKDPEKTARSYRGNLFTLGDIGHVDEDGYLYLTDRNFNVIISGGVNIYPQEAESCLLGHEAVQDVAVIGVPHDEMGEQVKALVVPAPGRQADSKLAEVLIQYTRKHIAHYKSPRIIEFVDELPRTETGKLVRRRLREVYDQPV